MYTCALISLDMVVSPIESVSIPSPPIFHRDWDSATRFPMGGRLVSAFLDDKIIFWGGVQKQSDGQWMDLPDDVIYTYQLPRSSTPNGEWKVVTAAGPIHPGSVSAASVVCDNTLFLMGGHSGSFSNANNVLSTLASDGSFQR